MFFTPFVRGGRGLVQVPVDVPSVADCYDEDQQHLVVDLIQNGGSFRRAGGRSAPLPRVASRLTAVDHSRASRFSVLRGAVNGGPAS